MIKKREKLTPLMYTVFMLLLTLVFFASVGFGSVPIPLGEILQVIKSAFLGEAQTNPQAASIILVTRIPRALCAMLVGASLSVSGVCMQGLLRNPLADGSTIGVSSGATLGATLAICLGLTFTSSPVSGTMVLAVLFAFLSMAAILGFSMKTDYSLSTNTIILVGVIFSMLVSALINIIITLNYERVKNITFWTMGSFQNSRYINGIILAVTFIICFILISLKGNELNALALGEDNARGIGVNVKRDKLLILGCVAALIGVSVSCSGNIAFVGLSVPHIVRLITGPNHKKLLPVSAIFGAVFMLLCDLSARTIAPPMELPVGVITSLLGGIVFIVIFYRSRKMK